VQLEQILVAVLGHGLDYIVAQVLPAAAPVVLEVTEELMDPVAVEEE
jgi:hypothetical protein